MDRQPPAPAPATLYFSLKEGFAVLRSLLPDGQGSAVMQLLHLPAA